MKDVQRIALINPTKFLGNLLLTGGLIQQLDSWCARHNKSLLIVLDESFTGLFSGAFPHAKLVWYPRKALLPGAPRMPAIRAWLACVRQIRAFHADLAFTIEEDSVCHRLTHLSGARHKVSSTIHRYHLGFDQVLDIARSHRPSGFESIWYSVRDVFDALAIPVQGAPSYVRLNREPPDRQLTTRLQQHRISFNKPLLLMHAGASKHYKQWPAEHFAALACLAIQAGYQVCLIGAGQSDAAVNACVMSAVNASGHDNRTDCVDLVNQLSLLELARLMVVSSKIVGNDSGPSHLASALGLPGVVIFGPTDVAIWRPLGAATVTLSNKSVCDATCTRHLCRLNYRCLSTITPQSVFDNLALSDKRTYETIL
ncbi:glycosyltransferase family 9 protein [Gammaproteobacteria bacterium LSUCC0112]|nr:glycosyltransferase family 9 protein [Gammaproteobacteria bacterium LSUCC0112]